jgi:hypothetical protein
LGMHQPDAKDTALLNQACDKPGMGMSKSETN